MAGETVITVVEQLQHLEVLLGALGAEVLSRPQRRGTSRCSRFLSFGVVGQQDDQHGLVIPARLMSGLWSGQPASIKLDDVDVVCAVLVGPIGEVVFPEPENVHKPGVDRARTAAAAGSPG